MPEKRSKPYCKRPPKTSFPDRLCTVIYINKLERETFERKLAAALARGDKLRDARLTSSRASSARLTRAARRARSRTAASTSSPSQ